MQPVNNIAVQHRFRFEQRFIPQTIISNNELIKEKTVFATRLRYFARAVIPFKKAAAFASGWFAGLQNELFVNTGNTPATNNNFFDQNRFYAAIGYRLTKNFDAELGFMNQYIKGRSINTANNIIQAAAYIRL
jgi:Protein of unknown function (DUF2490)